MIELEQFLECRQCSIRDPCAIRRREAEGVVHPLGHARRRILPEIAFGPAKPDAGQVRKGGDRCAVELLEGEGKVGGAAGK